MTEKSVEQRLKECKELIIQNMEKTLQHKMVYMFLKDRKKENDVKQYSVNSKDGIIKIEFVDHDKAEAFYNEANFNDKILLRPFNIYYSLALNENEMKKYYLEGITEENQRKLFEFARKIGPNKLYTSYGSGARSKLKPTGLLSFIRKDPIPEADYKRLTEDLASIGIKIYNYVQERGMKVSLNLINYISDKEYSTEESALQELAEKTARSIVEKYVPNANIQHLSVLVKKKEILDKNNPDSKTQKLQTSALFEFESTESTYANYEKIRVGIKDEELGKVKLFFHNEENNSFLSLITQGLNKPEGQTEKQFEETLIKVFREINANILQVNVFPMLYNNSYIGRVYLKSEEEGKNFLSDFPFHRSKIFNYYKDKTNIRFDITVDTKTLRKIKAAEKKAKETEEKIKKQTEANRRDHKRPQGTYPIPMDGRGPMMPLPGMVPGPGLMMPLPGMGGMGGMGGMPPRENMMGMAPMNNINKGMPGPGGMQQPQSLKQRINTIVRDKQRFIEMEENPAKRILSDNLRLLLEQQGLTSGAESTAVMNGIMKENKVETIISYLESPDRLREAVQNYKNKN